MINTAFHLTAYTLLFFLLGMYNPRWALFFMKKPDRITVTIITTVLVMLTMTLYGEGIRQKKLETEAAEKMASHALAPAPVPVPTPVPSPAISPATAAQKN